jgi:phosphohistidine phosphatase SixA
VRILFLGLILTCSFSIYPDSIDAQYGYNLYLIRHAEKVPDGSRDPVLTDIGKQRAEKLAIWFQHRALSDVWSSNYHRTRDTATPLLKQIELELSMYDPGDQSVLVKQLLDRQQNALVIGHSNTIPELARLLCECVIADMEDTEHDRLIVVTVVGHEPMVTTLQQDVLFDW